MEAQGAREEAIKGHMVRADPQPFWLIRPLSRTLQPLAGLPSGRQGGPALPSIGVLSAWGAPSLGRAPSPDPQCLELAMERGTLHAHELRGP
jgi:hypothetical protein